MSNETLNLGGAPISFKEGATAVAVTVTKESPEGTIPLAKPDTTIPSQLTSPVLPETATVAPKPEEEQPNFNNDVPADAEPAMEEVIDNDAELPPEDDPLAAVGIYTDVPEVEERPVVKAADPLETVIAASGAARIGVVSATAISDGPIEERTVPEVPAKEKIVEEAKAPETPKATPDPNEGMLRREFGNLFNGSQTSKRSTSDDAGIDLLFNAVVTGSREDHDNYVDSFKTDDELNKAVRQHGSFAEALSEVGQHGWNHSNMHDSLMDQLSANDIYKKLAKPSDVVRDFFTHGAKFTSDNPQNLTGKKARIAVMARMRGLFKVNLLNSGFYLILRAPQVAELQEFASSVSIEASEFGRELGNHFGLCADVFIKAKFIELLEDYNLIVESNFVDINKKGALAENLSYFDYDVIMWALVSLMYRNGLHTRIACTHCRTETPDALVDVSSTKWINTDLYTEEMINYWSEKVDENGKPIMRTARDLKNYRERIVPMTRRVVQKHGDSKIALVLKDPSMARFLNFGEKFMNDLNKTLHGPTRLREKQMEIKATLHLFQMFAPWIKELEILDENDRVVMRTDDMDAITDTLDIGMQKEFNLLKEINTYMGEARVNHIGTFSIQCPNCGAKPETGLDNFFPLDVETIFFALSCRP